MMAKYLATSLAMLNVVSAPRVIRSCLPISTTSMSFVGFESRSTMLPASLAACVPGVHRHGDVGLRERRGVVRAVAGHRDETPALLVLADERELGLRRGLREVIVDARLGGDGGGRQRVVAGDHHGLDAHATKLGEALLDAALDDVLELHDAEDARALGDDERRAALLRDRPRRSRAPPAGTRRPLH